MRALGNGSGMATHHSIVVAKLVQSQKTYITSQWKHFAAVKNKAITKYKTKQHAYSNIFIQYTRRLERQRTAGTSESWFIFFWHMID